MKDLKPVVEPDATIVKKKVVGLQESLTSEEEKLVRLIAEIIVEKSFEEVYEKRAEKDAGLKGKNDL